MLGKGGERVLREIEERDRGMDGSLRGREENIREQTLPDRCEGEK